MIILGIGGLLRDAATAIARDGAIQAAVEEAKLSRHQSASGLPLHSIQACLELASVRADEVQCVAVARPLAPGPSADLHLQLRAMFPNSRIVLVEHHAAHAASAYFASPFDQATVLTLDRAGDFRCGARWQASGNRLTLDRELYYPDSLGDLYSRVTDLLGYKSGSDEHKIQWLSASGDDRFHDLFLEMLPVNDGQWPRLDRSYFDSERLAAGGFGARFFSRLGLPVEGVTAPDVPEPLHAPIAAGLQHAIEQRVLEMAGDAENLCLSGGLAYNAMLVAALERSGRFRNVFVQPSAGNAGTALGAVFHAWHEAMGRKERLAMPDLYLGPGFTPEQVKQVLENCKLRFRYLLTAGELIETAVGDLNQNRIVAWMHGRMEFGPRALGNRSILASPLDPYSTENLNQYIKHRERFRKFAASVPAELASEYFDVGGNARALASVGRVRPAHRDRFESAILGGDWVRVHTVSEKDNPLYWQLLHAAGQATGLPVLYNTSFNLFGEPLVCTPRDAVRSFFSSGVDSLFVGNFVIQK